MTPGESNDTNAVEVDGIRFELLMPERVIIPVKKSQPEGYTSVPFSFRITNNTSIFYRFMLSSSFFPELIAPSGQNLMIGYQSDQVSWATASDFFLIRPGKYLTYSQQGRIFWTRKYHNRNKQCQDLQILIPFSSSEEWGCFLIEMGNYSIRFKYEVNHFQAKIYEKSKPPNSLEEAWIGKIFTSWVSFCLANPPKYEG
ncbi:hypothetical protein BCD67_16370 [Oscillatoriales cyanobacterium USR001]|nr:hypothetical protein BCD67_16370 [Oscillatoriales cyanobacterium USR001]